MRGKTHLAAGLCVGAAASYITGAGPIETGCIMAGSAFGSLWPDIDHKTSMISCRHKVLSKICNFVFGERGMLHDLRFYLIVMVALCYFIDIRHVYPVFMGIGTHLLLDAPTPKSIPMLRGKKRLFVIKYGGFTEKLTWFCCSIATIVLGCMWTERLIGGMV